MLVVYAVHNAKGDLKKFSLLCGRAEQMTNAFWPGAQAENKGVSWKHLRSSAYVRVLQANLTSWILVVCSSVKESRSDYTEPIPLIVRACWMNEEREH